MYMKNLNIHKLFFNSKAAKIFFITNNWVSIREASKYYNGLEFLRLEKKNPKEFLLKLWKDPLHRGLLKSDHIGITSKIQLEKMTQEDAKRILKLLDVTVNNIISVRSYERRRKKKVYTNPMVQKYCNNFKELGWVNEEMIRKDFVRKNKKGKLHKYSKSDWRIRMNLSNIVKDYIIKIKNIELNEEEKNILNVIFSIPNFYDFLIEEMTLYDSTIIDKMPNIANFVERVLFRFLYISTSIRHKSLKEENEHSLKILKLLKMKFDKKKLSRINEMIEDYPPISFCYVLCKSLSLISPGLFKKIVKDVLDTHLADVIRDNLHNNELLFVF